MARTLRAAPSAAAGAAAFGRRTAPAIRRLDPTVVAASKLAASPAAQPRRFATAAEKNRPPGLSSEGEAAATVVPFPRVGEAFVDEPVRLRDAFFFEAP